MIDKAQKNSHKNKAQTDPYIALVISCIEQMYNRHGADSSHINSKNQMVNFAADILAAIDFAAAVDIYLMQDTTNRYNPRYVELLNRSSKRMGNIAIIGCNKPYDVVQRWNLTVVSSFGEHEFLDVFLAKYVAKRPICEIANVISKVNIDKYTKLMGALRFYNPDLLLKLLEQPAVTQRNFVRNGHG